MMTRRRKIVAILAAAALAILGYFAFGVIDTVQHIPEAYAAWDTGTLLVAYMKSHDDQWPKSWDDLLTVLESEEGRNLPLRGAAVGDSAYAQSLKKTVSIDWSFSPDRFSEEEPVRRSDGSSFHLLWQSADPNKMVKSYLQDRITTRSTNG